MSSTAPSDSSVKQGTSTMAIYCLVIWGAVWLLWLLIRFSRLDIRIIPGIGPVMLLSLVVSYLAPIAAGLLAGVALIRQPRSQKNWLILGCAVAAFLGQQALFMINKWL